MNYRRILLLSVVAAAIAYFFFSWMWGSGSPFEGSADLVEKPLTTKQESAKAIPGGSRLPEWDAFVAPRINGSLADPRRTVRVKENGYEQMTELNTLYDGYRDSWSEEFYDIIAGIHSGKLPWDEEVIDAFLVAYAPAERYLDRLLAAEDFQFPERIFPVRDEVRGIDWTTRVYFQLKSEKLVRNARYAEAKDLFSKRFAVIEKLALGQGGSNTYREISGLQRSVYRDLIKLIDRTHRHPNAEGTLSMVSDALRHDTASGQAEAAIRSDYTRVLNSYRNVYAGSLTADGRRWLGFRLNNDPFSDPFSGAIDPFAEEVGTRNFNVDRDLEYYLSRLDIPKFLEKLDVTFQVYVESLEAGTISVPSFFENGGLLRPPEISMKELTPSQLVEISFAEPFSAMQSTVESSHVLVAWDRILRTRVAFERAYLAETKIRNLEELVPNFLGSVPIDPFSGAPLQYDNEGGILYSIGTDRKDGGGIEIRDHRGQAWDGEIATNLPISMRVPD